MRLIKHSLAAALLFAVLVTSCTRAACGEADLESLRDSYRSIAAPLIERYCVVCHDGANVAEGEIDLAGMSEWDEAARHPAIWQRVAEMLDNRLMPPETADQPSIEERASIEGWVREYLAIKAEERAGDPGRVILRRLSNAEYTNTLRDLTGVASLEPAREFPADGAAGEGFTNAGAALVMSPELFDKYLNAAKEVASHAVLLPNGFRFSPHTTSRDWTDDLIAQIRELYGEFTEEGGGSEVNLQGIVFKTNQGGRLPVEKYLAATIVERDALNSGRMTIAKVAHEHRLSAKYLRILLAKLNAAAPSQLLKEIAERWRTAKPEEAAALAGDIATWQQSLWKFSTVGLIGREGGPKRWMEPVDPLAASQEFRVKIPESSDRLETLVSLVATDAGDGNDGDCVVWQRPRLVWPDGRSLMLRDVRPVAQELKQRRSQIFSHTAACLNACDELASSAATLDISALAVKHGVPETELRSWLNYLGISAGKPIQIEGLFTERLKNLGDSNFVHGWGSTETPLVATNSSGEAVRIPGNVKAHGVVVHPSTTSQAAVGWRSPIAATVSVEAAVRHAHPECGNGVTWALEVRRGASRQRLAEGIAHGVTSAAVGPIDGLIVRPGDMVALSIGPRDANHSCDLTEIEVKVTAPEGKIWNLAEDIAADVLSGNPHADRFGRPDVWHFYAEPESQSVAGTVIPPDSIIAKWRTAASGSERQAAAIEVQKLLVGGPPSAKDSPDAAVYRQLTALGGPLIAAEGVISSAAANAVGDASNIGVDPTLFGHRPDGAAINPNNLCVHAPSVIEVRLPADLAAGCELVASGALDKAIGAEGSVQLAIVTGTGAAQRGQVLGAIQTTNTAPILVTDGSAAETRLKAAFDDFRNLFPPALCYSKIVPVDEVISATLFYREDDHLARLMLNDEQRARLDRLWSELHFVSRDALASVDAYNQLMEFATQDADPTVFEPLRKPIEKRAAAFQQQLIDAEPKQLNALVDFAEQAYRRPLSDDEAAQLRSLYSKLREEGIPHAEAFRLTLARLLVAPAFLYRIEEPVPGAEQGPVSNWELATRLSYFLWASQPDDELRRAAADGRLQDPQQLVDQARRMLRNPRVRQLATEFACQWLQINGFERLDEKSDRHFPEFASLRDDMAEEPIQFFTDLFQNNGSVLDILNADYTFLNEDLARHYGIPSVTGPQWRRVDGVKKYSRGGVLAQAATLSKQSGASRTSPILRGIWISEVLLGERLPKPPPGVPPLPDDEADTDGLTVRQLVEKHVSDPECATCHRRIDPYGFSLETFDAIGRAREVDLGDRPIDTRVTAPDGTQFDGLEGLRTYLINQRREAFMRQFCRKLLGYSLGRTVQLSDGPLLDEIQRKLAVHEYKVGAAIEAIVQSRQFREIRGIATRVMSDGGLP